MKILLSRKNQVPGESRGDGEPLHAANENGVRGGNLEFTHLCSALTFSTGHCCICSAQDLSQETCFSWCNCWGRQVGRLDVQVLPDAWDAEVEQEDLLGGGLSKIVAELVDLLIFRIYEHQKPS